MKAEEVRSEQLAAIEDVVKAEQNCTVDKPVTTFTEEDVSVGSLGGTPRPELFVRRGVFSALTQPQNVVF